MATIGKIRQRSGLMLIIIGGAMGAFILGDFFSTGGTQEAYEVGEVYGEAIPGEEYQMRIDARSEALKSTGQNLDDKTTDQIKNQVWQQIVRDRILEPEFEELGLTVTKEEFDDVRFGNNILTSLIQDENFKNQETGQFDPAMVRQYFVYVQNTYPSYWKMQYNSIVDTRTTAKYNNLIKKGVYVNSLEAKHDFVAQNKKVNLKYISKKYNTIADTAVVFSDSDLEDYYDKHKNESKFKQDKARAIEYISYSIKPSDADIQDIKNSLLSIKPLFEATENDTTFVMENAGVPFYNPEIYREGSTDPITDSIISNGKEGLVVGPYKQGNTYKLSKIVLNGTVPEVRASHILFRAEKGSAVTAQRAKADSVLKVVKAGGDFAELAKELSEDVGSGQNGGDLDWFGKGMMVPQFDSACFEMRKGAYSIVQTDFGVHLIKVTDKRDTNQVKLAVISEEVKPSSETLNDIYNTASSFSIKNTDLDAFKAQAKEQGLSLRSANSIKPQDRFVPGLQNTNELIRWVNKAEIGSVSEPIECGTDYVVAILTQINNAGIAPLENVRNQIEVAVKKQKKAEMLKTLLAGSSLDEIAKNNSLSIQSAPNVSYSTTVLPGGAGREPKVIGEVLTIAQGQVSEPIEGANGVYVVRVESVTEAGEAGDLANNKQLVKSQVVSKVDYAVYGALSKAAGVKDERYKFF